MEYLNYSRYILVTEFRGVRMDLIVSLSHLLSITSSTITIIIMLIIINLYHDHCHHVIIILVISYIKDL